MAVDDKKIPRILERFDGSGILTPNLRSFGSTDGPLCVRKQEIKEQPVVFLVKQRRGVSEGILAYTS